MPKQGNDDVNSSTYNRKQKYLHYQRIMKMFFLNNMHSYIL